MLQLVYWPDLVFWWNTGLFKYSSPILTRPITVLYGHMQYHNDTIIKTQEDFFRKIFVPLTLFVRVRKGCVGFYCEREQETEQKLQYFDPTLMAVSVVSFSFSSTAQPEALEPSSLVDDGFLYCILSATSLDPNSIGGPEPLRHDVAFLTTSRL